MKLSKLSLTNHWEIVTNSAIWIAAVSYSIGKFYFACKVLATTHSEDFGEGWSLLNSYQDISDPEWSFYMKFITKAIIPLVIHLIVSELIRIFKHRAYSNVCYITISAIFIFYHFTFPTALIIILQPAVIYLFGKNKNKAFVWIGCILNLQIITFFKDVHYYEIDIRIEDLEHFMTVLAIFWINLRCTSYFLDVSSNLYASSFIDMFAYAVYLPTLFTGPFISYSDFNRLGNKSSTSTFSRLANLIFKLARYSFWLVFIECILHFIYVNAVYFETQIIGKFDSWTLYGYGYCMGQYFHMKYVVMYGFSAAVAEFEGVKTPPTPKCIGRIHLYSDMWKYFDRGLYNFLLIYIYRPLINSGTILNKLVASLTCFVFVFCWHGVQKCIFIWASLNYIGIVLELLTKYLYEVYLKQNIGKHLSLESERRLTSLCATPLLVMSAISNFYFFAGLDIGNIYVHHILHSDATSIIYLICILYSCSEVATFIKCTETRNVKKVQ